MFEKLKKSLTGFADKVSTKTLSEDQIDDVLWELQLILLENDVALSVATEIGELMKQQLTGEKVGRLKSTKKFVYSALRNTILEILKVEGIDLFELAKNSKQQGQPLAIVFLGVNGTGKTTTLAKLTDLFQKKGFSVVLAASDTFRAGSIEQIEIHANRLGVRVIKHKYGSDSAAVAFDAVSHASAKNIDIVLIDTAGRMQTNKNLMGEMEKIVRVLKRIEDANVITVFVGDSLAGNDAVEQAREFNDAVGIDASILTKVDADAKGGAAISIAHVTKKPIIFIDIGQEYKDLDAFYPQKFAEKIVPESAI
ncbi:MAG: signal recognition particle-docking protein FtsY [Candidatus Sifarchaeia archaeon]|jgi:fused signal recognition particle receptor